MHEVLDTSTGALGCSPAKAASQRDRIGYGKRKVRNVHEATEGKMAFPVTLTDRCDRRPS